MVTVSFESLFLFLESESLLFEPLLQADKTKTKDNNKNKTVFHLYDSLIKFDLSAALHLNFSFYLCADITPLTMSLNF